MSTNQNLAKLAINKSLLKEYSNSEYSRIVYMKNNSEFQIQIFNPYTYTIGINITIDNKSLGNTLVLKPGERIWLERYLNEANKFLFSTYEVNGNSKQVQQAIAKNGEIKLEFFKEREQQVYINTSISCFDNWNPNQILYSKSIEPTTYCDAAIGDRSLGLCGTNAASFSIKTSAATSASYSATTLDGLKKNSTPINASAKRSKSIETGRVEKGREKEDENVLHRDYRKPPDPGHRSGRHRGNRPGARYPHRGGQHLYHAFCLPSAGARRRHRPAQHDQILRGAQRPYGRLRDGLCGTDRQDQPHLPAAGLLPGPRERLDDPALREDHEHARPDPEPERHSDRRSPCKGSACKGGLPPEPAGPPPA